MPTLQILKIGNVLIALATAISLYLPVWQEYRETGSMSYPRARSDRILLTFR
ncbi:MAG: hypothetical protein P5702_10725 [Limnospira sp. PMC 1291.21]|uniref:Uncharacterized protein n=1 Tax=Limnospira maxima CS-328 TaxID=513049 RepID=B5W465_LIMMA|nr:MULTISPECIES: hypothetical protein [Limnospira]EDZ93640.1 hypothetical protein AmaxDRAFT_3572 [Limnospira maxima CS-328]MDC0837488.1 hypothetical protein [Limnoraphis robusta]MDY7055214.1 hypothetical protein [Limnospira fusiformis LS22]UWU50411.1 hypothetical protein APLC1_5325 [Arthrospira platensis C1]MDT9178451.1 hypothetical protein [Limnospira sp. PMC 1238.20]